MKQVKEKSSVGIPENLKQFQHKHTVLLNWKLNPVKLFLSKNEKTFCWLGESPNEYSSDLTENLRIVFHSFEHMDTIKIQINGVEYNENPKSWEYIDFPISSQNINEIIFTYNNKTIDFTEQYGEIMMNQIYYNHR